jgi:5-methylthioadenosine/S-adenosylhomocysteine deaminase
VSERTLLRVGAAVPDADSDALGGAGVLVEKGSIVSVGRFGAVRQAYPLARVREAPSLVMIPGFVDAHSHGRGLALAEQGIAEGPLELWLARLWACTALDLHDDSFVAASDLLASGVTSAQIVFHSLAPAAEYRAAARSCLAGLVASGLEHELVLGFTDEYALVPPIAAGGAPASVPPVVPSPAMTVDEFLSIHDEFASPAGSSVTLGPVAPQWCSGQLWDRVAVRCGQGVRIHTHLLESRAQRSLLGPGPLETLRRFGLLGPRLSVAHAVWLGETEIAEVAETDVVLVHCPSSNRRLAGGTAPVRAWLDAGVEVALGLDSNAAADPPDMFDELRVARAVAHGGVSARDVFRMATLGGAKALGRTDIGQIVPGGRANFVLVKAPGESQQDLVDRLVERSSRRDVAEVWCNGVPVVEDGQLKQARAVEQARRRLRATLAKDAPARRQRLALVAALEPWLSEVWSLGLAPSPMPLSDIVERP